MGGMMKGRTKRPERSKIIGAMIQHVTYNEYLPHILGNQQMIDFELKPRASGYFTGYDQATKPQIRNGFSAAAFRFGHSMVRQRLAYNGPSHSNQSPLLRNEFLRPNKLGGLEHHSTVEALALKNIYSSPWDIDLFTGGVSETPIPGGKVGPTFACMIGLQFRALKFGDRFFYESNTDVKFTPAQLTEIKKATMARIICENTNINSIPSDVFRKTSVSNSEKSCSSLPEVNLQKWQNCVNGGWSSYVTINRCTKRRRCNRPAPNGCGKRCLGSPIKFTCGSILKKNQEI
ncbi:Hypothetical predicted protein [Mytilus galloprovincialis]|uniref:Uncharacterized protein n=1 Tax=Mytilus galloprovincialis TaxID=29158 RepID=A0A8B6BYB1_MYTGA|nr:Hypothetical predicted protein [Mytilus galloprovincialis]